jgi:hypothetical protein
MNTNKNNMLKIDESQLNSPLAALYFSVFNRENRSGLPRIIFEAKSEKFEDEIFRVIIERANAGYSVMATLNGFISHQVQGRWFDGKTPISEIFAEMAGFDTFESYLAAGQ